MTRKLIEMNDLIKFVVNKLDNDTILFVMGDHGMTNDGNHGGASEHETNTVIWAYTKKKFNQEIWKYDELITSNINNSKIINQIDFVPTLSMLLGIPIPFNNLGNVVLDFFIEKDIDNELIQRLINIVFVNLKQIHYYLIEFQSLSNKLSQKDYDYFMNKINSLEEKYSSFHLNELNQDDGVKLIRSFQKTIYEIQTKCRQVWTEFNLPLMYLGKIIMIISIIAILIILNYLELNIRTKLIVINENVKEKKIKLSYYLINISIIITGAFTFHYLYDYQYIEVVAFVVFLSLFWFTKVCIKAYFNSRRQIYKKQLYIIWHNVFFVDVFASVITLFLHIYHSYMLHSLSYLRTEGILFYIFFYIY